MEHVLRKLLYQGKNFLLILYALSLLTSSCTRDSGGMKKGKSWMEPKKLPAAMKWFLDGGNYKDSNYSERFFSVYNRNLKNKQIDSALYYLILFGEMLDQNIIYDSTFLKTATHHLNTYEPLYPQDEELIKLYYYIACQYLANGHKNDAMNWLQKCIDNPNASHRTRTKCRNQLAAIYSTLSQEEKAIPLRLAQLDYYVDQQDTINIGVSYGNLALSYRTIYAYELARKYLGMAIYYATLKKDTVTLSQYLYYYAKVQAESGRDTQAVLKTLNRTEELLLHYSKYNAYLNWIRLESKINKYQLLGYKDSLKQILPLLKQSDLEMGDNLNHLIYQYYELINQISSNPDAVSAKPFIALASSLERENLLSESRQFYEIALNKERKSGPVNEAEFTLKEKIYELDLKKEKLIFSGKIFDQEARFRSQKNELEQQLKKNLATRNRNNILCMLLILITILSLSGLYQYKHKVKALTLIHNKKLTFNWQLIRKSDKERKRIALELNKNVVHELQEILELIRKKIKFPEEKIESIATQTERIIAQLHPMQLEEMGLRTSIELFALALQQSQNLFVRTEINYDKCSLYIDKELNLYRIIEISLLNTVQHSDAESALVKIDTHPGFIYVEISDNGKGFDVEEMLKSGNSSGLLDMEQRCQAMNADLLIQSSNAGTQISFKIPA